MRFKYLFIVLTFFLIFSCNKKNEVIVKDILDNDVNILETKNEKFIIVSNGMVCHDCVKNLNEYIAKTYDLKKSDFYVLYEDPKNIPGRRWAVETYKNDYTPDIHKLFFTSGDSNTQKGLNIPGGMFELSTPYLIYYGPDKKPKYYSFETIFNRDGTVKTTFKIN